MKLSPHYPVATTRLHLRPLDIGDVDALLTYRGDPEVCRYLPFPPMTRDFLLERLDGDLSRTEITEEGQALVLGVVAKDTGRLLGDVVLFFRSQEHRAGEIGYVMHPGARGHGYAHEACLALLALAFEELGLYRVIARLDGRNEPSARLARRLGMRQEAHFVRNEVFKGERSDELVFAMLAEEWPAAATQTSRARSSVTDTDDVTTLDSRGFTLLPIHHVQLAIPPGGEQQCRDFWSGVLGLRELEKPAVLAARGGCWFRGGQLEVHLGVEDPFAPARKAHPGLLVDGLRHLADRLEGAGYPVVWDGEFPGHDRFYSTDPFGNRLEFLQPSSG